jgi:toxin YhaV
MRWSTAGQSSPTPLFLDQLEALAREVEVLKQKDPLDYIRKNAAKRLAAISRLVFEVIPLNPARPEYRQGVTQSRAAT